jgi:thymidylate synthase
MRGHYCFEGLGLNGIYNRVMAEFASDDTEEQASQFGKTRELMNCFIKIEDPKRRLILAPERKHSLVYLLGELIWYFSGERNVARIRNYSKFWEKLTDHNGEVNSNYGDKIFYKQFFEPTASEFKSQFDFIVDELKRDRDSRRAVLFLMQPEDFIKMHSTKDFPCTTNIHYIVRQGKLDSIVHMRSNDFILGFSNDMPFFSVLQEMIAVEIGVPVGTYYHYSDSMHLYERNYNLIGTMAPNNSVAESPFPIITPRDVNGIKKWADFETDIRTRPHEFNDGLLEYCPPFTQFVFANVLKHWREKT